MISNIFRSVALTSVVALLFSLISFAFGYNIYFTFLISFLGLVVLSFLTRQLTESLTAINNKKLENERIAEFSKQGTMVDCEYCGEPNFVPIRLDKKNTFECLSCKKTNAVYVDISATRITDPMTAEEAFKNLNETSK